LKPLALIGTTLARFFRFHSISDLQAECSRLGLDLRFSDDFTPLFQPVMLGPVRAGNRLCIQPMEGCDGSLDGKPEALTFRRYRRFGSGGAKIIWVEAAAVLDEARANPRQLLVNDATAPELQRMLQECRQAHRQAFGLDDDLVVGLQLTHSGRYSYRRPLPVYRDPILEHGQDPRPLLDDDYLKRLVDHYVACARLAWRSGFQFVDIKQCHRYLLSELLSARTRPGPYGGSLENRTRLARDIITAIRAEVPELAIFCRLNVYDGIPFRKNAQGDGEPCPWQAPLACAWGTHSDDPFTPDLTEPAWWIGEMHRLGVACVNVSMGNPYASPHIIRPFEVPPPDGYESPEHPLIGVARHVRTAAALQRQFPDLPMVGSGYSYLQEYLFHAAAASIRDGRIAIVGVGRAALPQPDFARQLWEHGQLDRKRVCRTFSFCTALMRARHNELGQFPTGCPPFDKEVYGPIWEQAKKKED